MQEKRLELRIDARIPLTVRSSSGWEETTETENVSTSGCLFSLKHTVSLHDELILETTEYDAKVRSDVIRVVPKQSLVGVSLEANRRWLELFVTLSRPKIQSE